MSLSEERKLLLKEAAENDGKLTMSMAQKLYSSKSSARSAVASLEFKGYIQKDVPGVFRIVKLPESVKNQVQS